MIAVCSLFHWDDFTEFEIFLGGDIRVFRNKQMDQIFHHGMAGAALQKSGLPSDQTSVLHCWRLRAPWWL